MTAAVQPRLQPCSTIFQLIFRQPARIVIMPCLTNSVEGTAHAVRSGCQDPAATRKAQVSSRTISPTPCRSARKPSPSGNAARTPPTSFCSYRSPNCSAYRWTGCSAVTRPAISMSSKLPSWSPASRAPGTRASGWALRLCRLDQRLLLSGHRSRPPQRRHPRQISRPRHPLLLLRRQTTASAPSAAAVDARQIAAEKVKIGIATGEVYLGSIGHPDYKRPDVIGEPVSIALLSADWAAEHTSTGLVLHQRNPGGRRRRSPPAAGSRPADRSHPSGYQAPRPPGRNRRREVHPDACCQALTWRSPSPPKPRASAGVVVMVAAP